MSDRPETEKGLSLVFREAARLHAVKSTHELLCYVLSPEKGEEFIERFGKPGLSREDHQTPMGVAYAFTRYYLAFCEACADPEKPIVVDHDVPLEEMEIFQDILSGDSISPW